MQHLDAMRAAHGQVAIEPEFRQITVRPSGSSDLQLLVSVIESREALGLPPYNVLPDGTFPSFIPPPEPIDDMDNEGHMSE
ncbi:hypothetical protein PybrP1_000270 [[Pythium] brassicae (nom. inval.)]|nr:hypothetical protein PybrP1_000270 [[Pythium] brassicae (nom. inval.)]